MTRFVHLDTENGDKYQPDEWQPMHPVMSEFAWKAGQVLKEFRDQWLKDHPDDMFARGIEMDNIAVLTDGEILGYLGLSEIDGASYDYFHVKRTAKEDE